MSKSPSIRILQQQERPQTSSNPEEDETHMTSPSDLERVADYRDYVFFSRLVKGIQQKQEFTQDLKCRLQNQALIDNIICTRTRLLPPQSPQLYSLHPSSNGISPSTNCDLIFDMEIWLGDGQGSWPTFDVEQTPKQYDDVLLKRYILKLIVYY